MINTDIDEKTFVLIIIKVYMSKVGNEGIYISGMNLIDKEENFIYDRIIIDDI